MITLLRGEWLDEELERFGKSRQLIENWWNARRHQILFLARNPQTDRTRDCLFEMGEEILAQKRECIEADPLAQWLFEQMKDGFETAGARLELMHQSDLGFLSEMAAQLAFMAYIRSGQVSPHYIEDEEEAWSILEHEASPRLKAAVHYIIKSLMSVVEVIDLPSQHQVIIDANEFRKQLK